MELYRKISDEQEETIPVKMNADVKKFVLIDEDDYATLLEAFYSQCRQLGE